MRSLQETPNFINVIFSDFQKQQKKMHFGHFCLMKSEKMPLLKLGVSCREHMLTFQRMAAAMV